MVSIEVDSRSDEPTSSPRISFSADFLDENNFISITPNAQAEKEWKDQQHERSSARSPADHFEFLSSKLTSESSMITADELFFEGKLRPYWQMHYAEKLSKVSLNKAEQHAVEEEILKDAATAAKVKSSKEESRPMNWFIDEDPSPRPPKCTVLWKELLRLKQKRASSLSPSSSSSSLADISVADQENKTSKSTQGMKDKQHVKRIKKGLDRSKSATLRVRPMIHVPICTQGKNTALPPLFSLKKGRAIESDHRSKDNLLIYGVVTTMDSQEWSYNESNRTIRLILNKRQKAKAMENYCKMYEYLRFNVGFPRRLLGTLPVKLLLCRKLQQNYYVIYSN